MITKKDFVVSAARGPFEVRVAEHFVVAGGEGMACFERFRRAVYHAVRACLHGGPGGKLAFDLARGRFAFCHLNGLVMLFDGLTVGLGQRRDVAVVHMDGLVKRGSGFADRAAEAAAGFLAHGLNFFRRVHDAAQLDFLEALVAARGTLELREEGRVANVVGGFLLDLFRPQDAANGGGPLLRRENRPACDAYVAVELVELEVDPLQGLFALLDCRDRRWFFDFAHGALLSDGCLLGGPLSHFAFYMENGGWPFWKTNAALAGG